MKVTERYGKRRHGGRRGGGRSAWVRPTSRFAQVVPVEPVVVCEPEPDPEPPASAPAAAAVPAPVEPLAPAATPHRFAFTPPVTLAEAEERIAFLVLEQHRIQYQLGNRSVNGATGEPLTCAEYRDWRRRACYALANCVEALRAYQAWLKRARLQVALLEAGVRPEGDDLTTAELLALTHGVARRLVAGRPITAGDEAILDVAGAHLRLQAACRLHPSLAREGITVARGGVA